MHLSIDFYSKNEISVDHNFTDFYGGYSDWNHTFRFA